MCWRARWVVTSRPRGSRDTVSEGPEGAARGSGAIETRSERTTGAAPWTAGATVQVPDTLPSAARASFTRSCYRENTAS